MLYKAIDDLRRGLGMYKIWAYQAWHEMTSRYKRTFLGSFWIGVQMVVTSLCIALVWGALMGKDMHEFLPYITAGILCFQLAGFMFQEGPEMFLSSANMIKNHAYPYTYYVFENVCRILLTFVHNIVVFWVVCICVGALKPPHWTIIFGLPIVLVSMASWGTVIGLISARFRDLRFMIPYIGQLLFYVTPIIWKAEDLSNKRAYVAQFNPLYGLLEVIRAPLLGHAPPNHCWTLALGAMITGVALWFAIFTPFRRRIPFWI